MCFGRMYICHGFVPCCAVRHLVDDEQHLSFPHLLSFFYAEPGDCARHLRIDVDVLSSLYGSGIRLFDFDRCRRKSGHSICRVRFGFFLVFAGSEEHHTCNGENIRHFSVHSVRCINGCFDFVLCGWPFCRYRSVFLQRKGWMLPFARPGGLKRQKVFLRRRISCLG